jgi:hypothetical protein
MKCHNCKHAGIDFENDFMTCKKSGLWSGEINRLYSNMIDKDVFFSGDVANYCLYFDDGIAINIAVRERLKEVITDKFLLERL